MTDEVIEDIVNSNFRDAFMLLFMNYVLGLVKQFQEYCKRPDIDIMEDRIAFTMAAVFMHSHAGLCIVPSGVYRHTLFAGSHSRDGTVK